MIERCFFCGAPALYLIKLTPYLTSEVYVSRACRDHALPRIEALMVTSCIIRDTGPVTVTCLATDDTDLTPEKEYWEEHLN